MLEFYKNVKISDHVKGDTLKRYEQWWNACADLEGYEATRQDREKMKEVYKRYADNTATSLVAVATRDGGILP